MTLYTSDTNKVKAWVGYLIAAVVVFTCGMVYEHFSHGVWSVYMTGAFLVPLLGGALPCFLAGRAGSKNGRGSSGRHNDKKRRLPPAADFQFASVATLTAGSLLQGALDIYGTSNHLMAVFPLVGIALAIAALVSFIRGRRGLTSRAA